jgi:hypothetical protein
MRQQSGKARPRHPPPIATQMYKVQWLLFAHSPSFLDRVWRFNFTPVVAIGAGATMMRMRCGASREGLFVGVSGVHNKRSRAHRLMMESVRSRIQESCKLLSRQLRRPTVARERERGE